LVGTVSNRDGYGAKVLTYLGERLLLREVDGGSSYLSQNSSVVHFGLGDVEKIDSLMVSWPSGIKDVYYNLEVNTFLKATEDGGLSSPGIVTAIPIDQLTPKVIVSPNPFSNYLEVTLKGSYIGLDLGFGIYNLLGQRLDVITDVQRISERQFTLHINASLSPSMYVLKVGKSNNFLSYKVIKQP
jgi:hypothetical protein